MTSCATLTRPSPGRIGRSQIRQTVSSVPNTSSPSHAITAPRIWDQCLRPTQVATESAGALPGTTPVVRRTLREAADLSPDGAVGAVRLDRRGAQSLGLGHLARRDG